MSMAWSPELSVGVEEIDNQHKGLIRQVSVFFEQLSNGRGAEDLPNLFKFIEIYVMTHFAMEEKYMTRFYATGHHYRDEKMHRAEHRAFLRDFAAFKEEFLENGPSKQLVEEFQQWIVNWLANHLHKVDKGLGAFMRETMPFLKGH